MSQPEIDQLLDDFVSWTRGRDDADPDQARIIYAALTGKPASAAGGPRCWRTGEPTELLLEIFPRTHAVDADWAAAAIPALRAFFRFADETGQLGPGSASAAELLAELDALEPQHVPVRV